MRKIDYIVPDDWDNKIAKNFLRSYCKISSRLLIKLKQVENGITQDGEHIRVIDNVKKGSTVSILIPDSSSDEIIPSNIPIDILFEDRDLIIINKPFKMPVHPSIGHPDDSLVNALCYYYNSKNEPCSFRIQNRLDADTTGIVVVSKNQLTASLITKNLKKTYYAICENEIEGSGVINLPIRLKEGYGIRREVGEGGEEAITEYEVIGKLSGYSLLKINLITGRTHQIRTHFSHLGHPLAGDDMYGGKLDLINRQALHCKDIEFTHPITNEFIKITTNFPQDMEQLLEKVKIKK